MKKTSGLFVLGAFLVLAGALGLVRLRSGRSTPGRVVTVARVVTFQQRAGQWALQGTVTPRLPAGLDLTFAVRDAAGHPPPETLHPRAVLTMLDHPMPQIPIAVTRSGQGIFRGTILLPMAGLWQMEIRVPDGVAQVAIHAQTQAANGAPMRELSNPITPTTASLAKGEAIYRTECQSCHGVAGAGDGPAARTLDPRPLDLRIHMAAGVHTDAQIFYWINEGFPGAAMPAFKDRLSEEDRWHVVNFLRTLALTDR